MQNPLFESLLKKVQTYENPQVSEQTTPPKGTIFSDFVKSLAQIGTKLVDQYIAAIKSYPDTKIKKEYEKGLPDKLAAILASVDKTKTVGIQVDSLFKAVKAEATAFFKLGEGDVEVVKFLKPWRESFRAGFNAYQQAVNSAMEYVKQQETAGTAKMTDAEYEMISKAVSASIEGYNKSIQVESTLKDDWGSNEGYSYKSVSNLVNESSPVLDQLISNKICVDFSTYNKIVNEAKEDRVARRAAKATRINGENLGAQIDAVLSVIGSRLSDPAKAKFKSLAMKDQFMSIATNLSQIQTELAIDDKELKNVNFGELDKQLSNLETLFADKKKSFEEAYAGEEKNSRSFKTLEVATPEVTKYLTDGDTQFGQLSILAQKAANMAAEEAKKPKPTTGTSGTSGTAGSAGSAGSIGPKVESAPVKKADVPKGKKNDEVKKFQDGVIAKYAKDKEISATAPYKNLKQSIDSGQGGYFGPKTESMVKMLKIGFKLSDTSSDITKELLDKINAQKIIGESRIFEQDFDYDAAKKFASGSGGGSSSKGGSGGGSGGGSPNKTSAFKCIKDLESGLAVSGGTATLKRDNGTIHEFKSDGTYRYYYKEKWMGGTWKCVEGGFEAYTKEDGDTYYSKEKNWKSNLDNAKAAAAEEASKAAAAIRTKGEEAAKGLLNALGGNSEDEDAVYKIFKEKITSKEIFDATETAWDSIWPSNQDLGFGSGYYGKMTWAEIFKKHHHYSGKSGYGLYSAIQHLFNDAETARLNGYLPSGVPKF
jgi:hypothetical protein